jgi:rubrerythrin
MNGGVVMVFGFNKLNKKKKTVASTDSTGMVATTDEDGNVEFVSKNFKMKATPKPENSSSTDGDTWICWGCGQATSLDVCPVCGKKKV